MYTLRIEHPTADYERWKKVFDSDPLGRRKMGVRQYKVFRAADDPKSVLIDLEFDTAGEARAMIAELKTLWGRLGEGLVAGTTVRLLVQSDATAMDAELRSIRDPGACAHAADLVGRGRVAGTFIRGVGGLWADGANPEALGLLDAARGEKRELRPAGTILDAPEFVAMLDSEAIAEPARDIFLDPGRLIARLGSLCFLRMPVRRHLRAMLPARLLSSGPEGTMLLQNWIPRGCKAASEWCSALLKRGIGLPVGTSMNRTGEPVLTSQDEGLEFCRTHDVQVFLCDLAGKRGVRGSFPIVDVGPGGVRVLREGHFPASLFTHLLQGVPVDLSTCAPASHPIIRPPAEILEGSLTGDRLRLALIDQLDN